MISPSAIHDPLGINLRKQTRSLLNTLPPSFAHTPDILDASSNSALLEILSRLLLVPALTLTIATLYRPILLDLCARWLEEEKNTEEQMVALSLLIEVHEELFPVLYRLLRKPSFHEGPLAFITAKLSPLSVDGVRLQRLLLAYYRILHANRELPRHLLWPLSPLSHLIWTPHLDNGVRLLSIRCYALQSGMGEAERETIEREVLGESCGVDCTLDFGKNMDGSQKLVDGWIMPVIEVQRIKSMREEIMQHEHDYYATEGEDHAFPISPSELSPLIANIHGVFMLRSSRPGSEFSSPLISTPTTVQALQSLAFHISLRLPTLITSPPSSGKSLFISHLAEMLHPGATNQIITIHLADTSLDPRALLGSYTSSPTQPGTFEWREGVIVRSMREGKWVVLEDIDKGSSEVLGVIKPLVESLRLGKWVGGRASLDIPTRGRVVAHDTFALFATRSTLPSRNGGFPSPVFFGAHKFHEVIVHSPPPEELQIILNSRFPQLAGSPVAAFIRLWEAVKAVESAASTRDIGLRELEKFCTRVQRLLPNSHRPMNIALDDPLETPTLFQIFPHPTLREDMYLEARDVFFGAGTLTASARTYMDTVAFVIGEHLGLDADRREWVLRGRTLEFDLEKDVNGNILAVRIGRSQLSARIAKIEIAPPTMRPFAMHRPAILLISRIATALTLSEPVLLTGETGTGKTSVVTHLSSLLNRPLISLNLSHQTESSDLIGGFKPIDARIPASTLQQQFLDLFGGTFSRRKNEKFETEVRKAVGEGKWKRAVGLWKESGRLAKERIQTKQNTEVSLGADMPRKRRKVEGTELNVSEASWDLFLRDVNEFEVQHVLGKGKFAFGFVEGPLVKALRSGDWVLLDEINLASPETLECVYGLLHGPTASITLTEHGSLEPVPRHPDFRLFACMNPATDIGKKDLPPNIRSRFTEIDVPSPDADKETLLAIISQYIGASAVGDKGAIMNVAEFYSAVKELAEKRQIADGANHRPHYSMRTLARALMFASDVAGMFGLKRAIWEGCLMAFTMVLDDKSAKFVTALAHKHLLAGVRNPGSVLTGRPSVPYSRSPDDFIKFGPFYLERGPVPEDPVEEYVMTPSVETKLIDLARIILTRRFPILIEGPTSSGKTSSVEYLAKRTGHRFVRINNHEHTDIQEYIGSYVSDPLTGKLVFKDGLLVRALRNGDWIVLDELNLAPTDVLEALNRLLDDNRELVIPETQEVVKPHPHFMLFATQNPPGLYAGRKVLSRAFRNRFLEVHFEDVPQAELETILCERCRIAPSYGKRIVSVFHELQKRRQSSRVFESKQGFATLRDLFRWAGRDAIGYQELAENGYMLLGERARREDDKAVVKEVIESVMKVKIDERAMYTLHDATEFASFLGCPLPGSSDVVWTSAMQRLFILVARALRFNEPVLLVGETGSGKTSVCQTFAEVCSQRLHSLNLHQNTETADLIGGLRPLRNRSSREAQVFQEISEVLREIGAAEVPPSFDASAAALNNALASAHLSSLDRMRVEEVRMRLLRLQSIFEWHDGPLIEAMRNGDVFLLDEISLADDSVLERLNSVLEPSRTIVLAERGGDDLEHPSIQAEQGFKLVATMNPGGDYGKKELSPALRNRFTEIWVPRVDDRRDLELIVNSMWKHSSLEPYTPWLLDFTEWLCTRVGDSSLLSLRDIIAWVTFTNASYEPEKEDSIPLPEIFHHAAHMTFLDGLGSLPQLSGYSRNALLALKDEAISKLLDLVPLPDRDSPFSFVPAHDPTSNVQFGSFAISRGPAEVFLHSFNLQAPTTRDNAMRIVRACQVLKPILLEGSPGVGKTSLITALANISGRKLCRINLSDQTDLIDLFGSDLPVEGGGPGEFAWRDGEFLKALQEGHWVLLDEMNLAPQAVLEGLNAVLDHRGTVYIPELGRSFVRHPSFRIFAAQNPLTQGGGRKGLPKSFVNRFTKVYIEELSPSDLFMVCQHMFPDLDQDIVRAMISFNKFLNEEVAIQRRFGREGSPWEFNLRDVMRWGTLLRLSHPPLHPVEHLRTIYLQRFRTRHDRALARELFDKVFSRSTEALDRAPNVSITPSYIQLGYFVTPRKNMVPCFPPGRLLKMHLSILESIGYCISQSWLAILTGPRNCGKTEVVRTLSYFTGNVLQEISMNSATDTMDILGSFEQVDIQGRAFAAIDDVISRLDSYFRSNPGSRVSQDYACMLRKARQEAIPIQAVLRMTSEILTSLRNFPQFGPPISGKIEALISATDTVGRFEWIDGPLVRAMKHGHWMLMDGANLCNPSVLDRLNSLCEPGGFLTLSECGYVDGRPQTLRPHPNFRLFMTIDPQYGELSRAMRNRGIEISFNTRPIIDDPNLLLDFQRLPWSTSLCEETVSPSILFDAARRGLTMPMMLGKSAAFSSGRIMDQDSQLASLLDQSPMIIISALESSNITDGHLFFLARTIPPLSVVHFSRFVEMLQTVPDTGLGRLQSFLNLFPSNALATMLSPLRKSHSTLWEYSSDHVFAQPMDFYLSSPSRSDGRLNAIIPPEHRTLLRILDLAVSLFLDHEDRHTVQAIAAQEQGMGGRAAGNIVSVLEAISQTGSMILSSTPDSLTWNEVNLAYKLLGYARYLRKVTEHTSLDFSAVQAISKWILDVVEDCPSRFTRLAQQAQSLSDAVSLSSGFGLIEIWSTLLVESPFLLSSADLIDIDNFACCLKTVQSQVLRRQAFDLMSLRSLPGQISGHADHILLRLKSDLERLLIKHQLDERVISDPDAQSAFLIAELGALLEDSDPKGLTRIMSRIIELAYDTRSPLLRFVSYQHLVWTGEAGQNPAAATAQAQKQWLSALWDNGLSGPSILLQPTQLNVTLKSCDWTKNSLNSLEDYEAEIRRNSRLMSLQCEREAPRIKQLEAFLYRSCAWIAACFSSSFNTQLSSHLDLVTPGPAKLEGILGYFEQSNNQHLKSAMQKNLRPSFQSWRKEDEKTREQNIADVGLCWIAVGNLIVDLFVPDTPVDPAAIQNCTTERWHHEEETLKLQLELHRKLEELVTGNPNNEVLEFLSEELHDVSASLSHVVPVPVRKDVSRLHMFWSEVSQFLRQILSPSKIQGLLALLRVGNADALLQEQVVQQSMAGFCQRLDSVYPEYADLSFPLHLAILHIRTGMRLLAISPISASDNFHRVVTALVAFPSVRSCAAISVHSTTTGPPGISPSQHLLLSLSAFSREKSIGVNVETQTNELDLIYEQLLRLWLIDRAKEKEMGEASQSLYRRKNLDHDIVGDAELEEQEFLALFPTFEDALDHSDKLSASKESSFPELVQPPEMHQLVAIHTSLLDASISPNQANLVVFHAIRQKVLQDVLDSCLPSLPDTLDSESRALQLSLFSTRLSKLHSSPSSETSSYNFYTQANVVEVRKATTLLDALKTRLEVLIQEWPDQMVLHHLKSRCEAILELELHSPVAKVLSALEQLLLQTEDWEIYSNRHNSLKPNQHELIRLIVEWRRLELSCWQTLLESQARTFVEGVSEWWFRLYDATVRGPIDAWERGGEQEAPQNLDKYIDTLIPLLDDFIRSSPLGQYKARMELLHSFENYTHLLVETGPPNRQQALGRIRCVLNATAQYYDLYADKLSNHLGEQKALLEKEIRDFIKLASWRDINVQALKASAQRTHHQLYKIIRKFRDVLRQPISERLQPLPADNSEARPLSLETVPRIPTPNEVNIPDGDPGIESLTHLVHLGRTFRRLDSLITSRVRPFIHSRSAHIVDNLAVEVIVTSKELSSLQVPSDVPTDKREQRQKAILVRKRKAWSDLLKELKRAGFATNMKPDALERHVDPRWLREQPIMPEVSEPALSTQKSEHYFLRLYGALPQLRSSVSNHHSDLTTRELQRGVMLLESSFSFSLDLRSRLAEASTKYTKLEHIFVRLNMVNAVSKLAPAPTNLLDHSIATKNTLCRLRNALQEVETGIHTFNELQPNPTTIPGSFIDEIRALNESTNVLQAHVTVIIRDIRLTPIVIFLESERNVLSEASSHIFQTLTAFRNWAERYPNLHYLIDPVSQWLSTQAIPVLVIPDFPTSPPSDAVNEFINTILLTTQALVSNCPDVIIVDDDVDKYILRDYHVVRDFTHLMNIENVLTALDAILLRLTWSGADPRHYLQQILPFLGVYMELVRDQLVTHSQWTKALFKLNFVLCSVMQTLSTQGFCKPPEVDDTKTGGDSSEVVEGTGLGEGAGSENVSKDIEDESQVEGLQGEDTEDQGPRDDKDDGDAIEMSEDIGGKMEDVPDTESQDDAESDNESDVDPEERLGDLDASDPSAIDEKLWGDEKGPESDQQDEKTSEDHSKEQSGDSDVVAKEGKDRSKKEEKGAGEKESKPEENAEPEDQPVPENGEAENEETNDPGVSGAPMDEYVEDANTLDLPDDIDLGDDMDLGGEDMQEDIDADPEDPDGELIEDVQPEPPGEDNVTDQHFQEDPTPEDTQNPSGEDQEMETDVLDQPQEAEPEVDNIEDNLPKEDAIAQADISSGDGMTSAEESRKPDVGESAATGQAGGTDESTGKDAGLEDKVKDNERIPESHQPQPESLNADSKNAGAAASGTQDGHEPSQPETQALTNPLRSLGDALKEIRQRFDDILSGEQRDVPREKSGDVGTQSQVEYLHPDDADHDMQALGSAGEEQAAKLSELKLIDSDDDELGETGPMDVDPPTFEESYEKPPREQPSQAEPTSAEHREDIEGAILQSADPSKDRQNIPSDPSTIKADVDMDDNDEHSVEMQLRNWQSSGFPDSQTEHIWRLYESLTHDLAYALCEQLRLILEPTLATRLKGDYRTGKRLNMKKIISYIASDYTKDKIWLRRTRPSQREYQVLIAIDDSRSMAESHSVHLAYETLALVSKALSRLEAGDIAIAKFGETVDILHGFDEGPFTDQAGTNVMGSFRFNQKATNVLSLVETSLKMLERARERRSMSSATAADLWQLEIIISDGMCQDHDHLRTVLRKAEEQRVMIVFVIIDSLHSTTSSTSKSEKMAAHGSILSMDKAEFVNIDGRMELQLVKYLDSFPFEYYVVLRNVEALPEVLTGTLKQFFERISEE